MNFKQREMFPRVLKNGRSVKMTESTSKQITKALLAKKSLTAAFRNENKYEYLFLKWDGRFLQKNWSISIGQIDSIFDQ